MNSPEDCVVPVQRLRLNWEISPDSEHDGEHVPACPPHSLASGGIHEEIRWLIRGVGSVKRWTGFGDAVAQPTIIHSLR